MKKAKVIDIKKVVVCSADMLRFTLNNGYDWVWVTYKDDLGFLSIYSSFGNYAFSWASRGENVTLRDFFIKASPSYLANKFFIGNSERPTMFDIHSAKKELMAEINSDLRVGNITKSVAKILRKEVREMDDLFTRNDFIEFFCENSDLLNWNQDFCDRDYGMNPSPTFLILQNEIIPMIQKQFKEMLLLEAQAVTSHHDY